MNPETNYIRLRGLPFAAKEQDVRDFLQGLNAKVITFTLTSNGRASGECYVELDDQDAVKEAQKLDRNEINGRYIEVFTVSDAELSMMVRHGVIKGSGGDSESRFASNFVVRLRGLPYSATVDDIKEFFSGLEVADAVIDKEPGGRPSGEAFVRLASKEHAELALERSKNYMGSRYVEVFRSSAEEMDHSFYAARGIPPPSSGPVPLRGISPTLDFRFRDRYAGDFGGRYGGPMRLSSLHPRPSPYERPYYERERYYRYGSRYDPEFDEAMYDPAVKVFMRGLPYSVTTLDIEEFFRPLNCVEIKLGYNEERRLSGDALVTFSTMAEAREALARNKKNMGTRSKKRGKKLSQKRSRISEETKKLLRKRRAMKKENLMNDEYAALCKQIRHQMKKDFEEFKRWKKQRHGFSGKADVPPEDETTLEDFEKEMEAEFAVENTGRMEEAEEEGRESQVNPDKPGNGGETEEGVAGEQKSIGEMELGVVEESVEKPQEGPVQQCVEVAAVEVNILKITGSDKKETAAAEKSDKVQPEIAPASFPEITGNAQEMKTEDSHTKIQETKVNFQEEAGQAQGEADLQEEKAATRDVGKVEVEGSVVQNVRVEVVLQENEVQEGNEAVQDGGKMHYVGTVAQENTEKVQECDATLQENVEKVQEDNVALQGDAERVLESGATLQENAKVQDKREFSKKNPKKSQSQETGSGAGPSSSDSWEPVIKGRYIELFPATNIPHPIKTVTFRTVSGAPTRLSAAPRPLYSSFADDEEAAYGGGVGGQQYYNDQYEGRQSKYGRDWGEPTRTAW